MEKITIKEIRELCSAASLAGFIIEPGQIVIKYCKSGNYKPEKLSENKMAIYLFFYFEKSLKVGKVNKGSNPRYQYQHYNPNSNRSVLAKNLIENQFYSNLIRKSEVGVEEWMLINLDRYNILIDTSVGRNFLHFAEAFFILKFNPEFEKGT